jgi:L-seryl-tRNA(Ser) seleniumtransferase
LQDDSNKELLRHLPRTDRVAQDPTLDEARARVGMATVTALSRAAIADARSRALTSAVVPSAEEVVEAVRSRAEALWRSRARRVINATGVVLHTNLGRAPLADEAVDALAESARGYTSIELDLQTGKRGRRGAFMENALCQLTGAEAALVVNNCAAAVLLVLAALARGKGVVVSRGEQIEIGGGFRIPEVLARSGARMVEVGTTNKTRLSDYERAIDENEDVAVLLRVHQTNFRQVGFVEQPELGELASLARERGVLLIKDLGGGALVDLSEHGLRGEPVVQDCVRAGAHVVCFSCDKVLGGPQGGAIVGEAQLMDRVRREPLTRAFRLGRLPMVALEATLASYLAGELEPIPALHAMRAPASEIRERVEGWVFRLTGGGVDASVAPFGGAVGAGALSEKPIPSFAARVKVEEPDAVAARLRAAQPPVMACIQGDALYFDGRTVLPGEDDELVAAILAAAGA